MYDILDLFCSSNSWVFDYGRSDFHNLFDSEADSLTPHVFLDPVITSDNSDDFGNVQTVDYSGSFMIVLSSDFDEEGYKERYDLYIKPILDNYEPQLKNYIVCNHEVTFNSWRKIEIVNALDMNFDGLVINYNVSINV